MPAYDGNAYTFQEPKCRKDQRQFYSPVRRRCPYDIWLLSNNYLKVSKSLRKPCIISGKIRMWSWWLWWPCHLAPFKRSIFDIDSHIVYGISHKREGGYLAKGENWNKGHNFQLQLRIATTRNWCYSIVSAESSQQASAVCELWLKGGPWFSFLHRRK